MKSPSLSKCLIAEQAAYEQLSCYTLSLGDDAFIHQHVVDAWTAQKAAEQTKPIALVFALVGLFMFLERGFTGRQIQRAHVTLARRYKNWPRIELSAHGGDFSTVQVMAEPEGPNRIEAINTWCTAVWSAHQPNHAAIREIVERCVLN